MKERVMTITDQLENNSFQENLEKYMQTKYKLQLFILAKAMKELENCSNVLEFPNIILNIKSKVPKIINDRSKIKQLVQNTILTKKKTLLEKFYAYFEEQFHESNTLHDIQEDLNETKSTSNWELFLQRSRNWLLSYTLVSLLSATLFTTSKNTILETFQDSLDTALTPLWGRFYYHLQISLESKSKQQIMWTFYYAKSFIEMLFNLIIAITQSKELIQLYELNYLLAAKNQILEKSIKFLKAHIASIFVLEFIPWNENLNPLNSQSNLLDPKLKYLLQIIEEIFELDSWLLTYYTLEEDPEPNATRSSFFPSSSLSGGRRLGITEVIYDSKEIFHHWLLSERTLVIDKIKLFLTTEGKTFSLISPAHPPVALSESHVPRTNESSHQLKCYYGIYECLSYFLLLSERYSLFPPFAQNILSEVILEPLLCFMLGLLLYHLRSVKILFQISINTFINKYPFNEHLYELDHFMECVSYLRNCLTASETAAPAAGHGRRKFPMIGNSSRCKKKWTIVQNWIPKILITADQQASGFGLMDLMKISFKLPEKYQVTTSSNNNITSSNQFEYRSTKALSVSPVGSPEDDIAESAAMVIELAETLVQVLQNHLQK
jgi:hypothetical protein